MAEPVLLHTPTTPCNQCGAAACVMYYAWREPGYEVACSLCRTQSPATGASLDEALERWQAANPSCETAHLRNSPAQQARRAAQVAVAAAYGADDLSLLQLAVARQPDLWPVIDRLIRVYAAQGEDYDFNEGRMREWLTTAFGFPYPEGVVYG